MYRHLTPLCFLAATAVAAAQDHRPPVDPISPHVRGTWEAFVNGAATFFPTFDPGTGRLREARGILRVAPNGVDERSAAAAGRIVLRQLDHALGVPAGDLFERGVAGARGGLFHVGYVQRVAGLPVHGSSVDLRFSAAGDLLSVRAKGLLLGATVQPSPEVTRQEALELARVSLPGGTEQADAWRPELVVLPEDGGTLAWMVVVSDPSLVPQSWHVILDAQTGVLLGATEGAVEADVSGKVEGYGTPVGTQEANPEAKMPLSKVRVRVMDSTASFYELTSDDSTGEVLISPDGSRLFWTSDADGDFDVYTQLVDGVGLPSKLTDNDEDEYDLATDETGSKLWFTSKVSGNPDVWSVLSDGTGLTQITTDPGIDDQPSVPLSGFPLFFRSDRDGDFDIYKKLFAAINLTANTTFDSCGVVSGDGTTLGYLAGTSAADAMVWTMAPDGTGATQLVSGSGFCDDLSISNDGAVIFFERWLEGAPVFTPGGPGGLNGAFGGRATHSPTVWAATSDGIDLVSFSEGAKSYQIDPDVAGDNGYVAWAEKTDAGDLDIVHMELLTGSRLSFPAPGDQTGPSLADDGLLGGAAGLNVHVIDLRPSTGASDVFTDPTGTFGPVAFDPGTSVSVEARLAGKHVLVHDEAPSQKDLREYTSVAAPDATADLLFNETGGVHPLKTAQVTAYAHHSMVHDHLEMKYLGLGYGAPLPFDGLLLCNVNNPAGIHNAFYNFLKKETRYFVGRGASLPNTCFDSVVYHEYGHYCDDMFRAGFGGLLRPGDPWENAQACTEAIADWVSILTSHTGVVGAGWDGKDTWIRNYDVKLAAGGSSDRQWDCLDCTKKKDIYNGGDKRWIPHQHGEALAGFGHDLRMLTDEDTATQILLDTMALAPTDMRDAVDAAFDVDMIFNGGANFDAMCVAARRHGFDCKDRPDRASHGCHFIDWCGPLDAIHFDTGPETIGLIVDEDPVCGVPDGDEDGVFLLAEYEPGETVFADLVITVDPMLLKSGRYGGLKKDGSKNELHYLYVNAWLLIDDFGGELDEIKVLGTGSGNTGTGVAGFAADTFAIDPDAHWGGSATGFYSIDFDLPEVEGVAILRVRLDYGEDGGRADLKALGKLNDPMYSGACGPARSGEVEEYHITMAAPGG